MKLTRIEDKDGERWYTKSTDLSTPGYEKDLYAGVTGVLEVAVPKQLKNYFMTNSKNKQEKHLKATGDVGSEIHTLIEADLKGSIVEPPEALQPAFNRYKELKAAHGISMLSTEVMVASEKYGWGGTFDMYGMFDGKPTLLDWKTGFVGVKAGWQLAAYYIAGIEMGLFDKSVKLVVCQIKRDGSIGQPFCYEHIDWLIKSWCSCFEVWKALNFTRLNKMEWKYLKINSWGAYESNH